jgi:hypothetical protein
MTDTDYENPLGLPDELVPLLVDSAVCEYASIRVDGTPVTSPIIPYRGEDGRSIDISTGLTFPLKADRARRNPKVCLAYTETIGSAAENPPVALVYGQASVRDADLQANTDRYVRTQRERFSAFRRMPQFMLRWLEGYFARIWIEITPLKVLWWPDRDLSGEPKRWHAPPGTYAPPSDPAPEPLPAPHDPVIVPPTDWRREIPYAIDTIGLPILTVVDEEGYPTPFRVLGATMGSEGIQLALPAAVPAAARGRGCLTFHTLRLVKGEMATQENMSFIGDVIDDGGSGVRFEIERRLPDTSIKGRVRGLVSFGLTMRRFRRRLETEASRRGQPVPKVRVPPAA